MTPHEYGLKRITYSVAEAGEALSLGRATLYELAESGELPRVRFGKKILFAAVDLARLLDRRRGVTVVGDQASAEL